MAKKHTLTAKYTDFCNGRYAYIWCPLDKQIHTFNDIDLHRICTISSYIIELNTQGFDVITTDLFCTGVKID